MANVFAPFGFQAIRRVDGASWSGNVSVRKIAAANTHYFFKGDPVASLTTGYIDVVAPGSLPGTKQIAGIFVGCEYLSVAKGYVTWSPMFPGGDTTTDVIAYIIDDPNVLFAVQSNNSNTTATAMGISYIGNNISYASVNTIGTSTAGNTLNGISGVYIDQYTASDTIADLPFHVYDIPNVQTSGGAVGTAGGAVGNGYDPTTPYNIIYVSINSSDLRAPQNGI